MTHNHPLEIGITKNQLLSALPSDEYEMLRPKFEETDLSFDSVIYVLGQELDYVYFPISGVISLLAGVSADSTLEIGLVGNEGMAGLPLFLGMQTSYSRAIVQGRGTALRMGAEQFVTECAKGIGLSKVLMRYAHSMLVQISQSAVCYRFHLIEQRMARWLLMTSDRMETNEFQMTQNFLSNMLGVRREAVNKAAGTLQKQNFISYKHGRILILDRFGLEAASCKCYEIIRDEQTSFPVTV